MWTQEALQVFPKIYLSVWTSGATSETVSVFHVCSQQAPSSKTVRIQVSRALSFIRWRAIKLFSMMIFVFLKTIFQNQNPFSALLWMMLNENVFVCLFFCCGFALLLSAVAAATCYLLFQIFYVRLHLSVFLLSPSYETVFQFVSVFFFLVGGVGWVGGRGMKTDHTHRVSAIASRKDK